MKLINITLTNPKLMILTKLMNLTRTKNMLVLSALDKTPAQACYLKLARTPI